VSNHDGAFRRCRTDQGPLGQVTQVALAKRPSPPPCR